MTTREDEMVERLINEFKRQGIRVVKDIACREPNARMIADGYLDFGMLASAALSSERDLLRERVKEIAAFLIEQHDEPWPSGSESDRLHYWRDKAIKAANRLTGVTGG